MYRRLNVKTMPETALITLELFINYLGGNVL